MIKYTLHIIATMALLAVGQVDAAIYCSSSSNTSSYEWINSVTVNGTAYNSGNNGGYALQSAQAIDSQQISLTLTPGFGGVTYPENWGVWIDWNQDGLFDAAEQEFSGSTSSSETLTATIAVPPNAMTGELRMRVVMTYGSAAQACGTYAYGETEDFPIVLIGSSPPPPPPGGDPLAYCDSSSNVSSYEWINSVTVNGTPYSSGNNGGYILHPVQSIDFPQITLTLTPGFGYATYGENWGVWVDWNQDGVFDATEQSFSGQTTSTETLSTSIPVPADVASGETRMRVVMTYGGAAQACGIYTYGETEDFPIIVSGGSQPPPPPPPAQTYPFSLNIAPDYTVTRNGPLDADLTWVFEKDGVIVLQANATYLMQRRYHLQTSCSTFRVWLNDSTGTQVSNIIEYTVGITYNYQLSVDPQYGLHRSGILGESLTWVIEKDGGVVLERNASNELDYTYFDNTMGSHVRVWLKQFINGQYQRVSNYVDYVVGGNPLYELSIDQSHRVMRTGYLGEPVQWCIERDGIPQGCVDASFEIQWVDFENAPGSTYAVTLVSYDGFYIPVSNTVQFTVDDLPVTHTLFYDGNMLTRSGSIGESLTWVIENNGTIVLQRNAQNELQYSPGTMVGPMYRFWLIQYINGGYQRVSNIVTPGDIVSPPPPPPPPPPTQMYPFSLNIAPDYTVTRNGPLDADLTWVFEKDGVIVLQANAKYSMQGRYHIQDSGSNYKIWLKDNTGTQVSNVIEYTVGITYNYQLSVDPQYGLHRSGMLGESLTWVIEKDGGVVLERNASNELDYTYFDNTMGSHVRVWLKQFINGQYQRVSNYVDYVVGVIPSYELSIDQSHRVMRTGYLGEPVMWRIERDGMLQGYFDASFNQQWVDYENTPGSIYTVTLVANDGMDTPVSNVVQYTVDDQPISYSLDLVGGTLTRSGILGDSLTWVIEKNGRIVLERNASNELQYAPTLLLGSQYRFWLKQFINGGYQRVSNIVTKPY